MVSKNGIPAKSRDRLAIAIGLIIPQKVYIDQIKGEGPAAGATPRAINCASVYAHVDHFPASGVLRPSRWGAVNRGQSGNVGCAREAVDIVEPTGDDGAVSGFVETDGANFSVVCRRRLRGVQDEMAALEG